ncbi:Mu transposase C-terminal domain-containing protein [Methylophilus sp. 'Pure River']|uniref:Mu transposase C-terminal domain-containing protein n=1 Tax=Methylophilus sp. 'Pure River' TaxID=3377117 RepID=UPI00398E5682
MTTPLEKWQAGERERIIKHPAEPALLEVIAGHQQTRRVFHYGLEVNGLHYNNDHLQKLRRQYGEELKVDFKYYEDDMGYIHVFDPFEKLYFKVHAIHFEYADGLRLVQHQSIRSALREQQKDPHNRELLLQNKQELQQIVTSAIHHNKMGKRKRQAVLRGKDSRLPKAEVFTLQEETFNEDATEEIDLPNFEIGERKSNQRGERE